LSMTPASSASLLLNLEGVLTALLAWFLFKENFDTRIALGMALIATDGSGSGNLLPSGEVFFCHDTEEPIMFDPVSGMKWYPPDSGTAQGCHIVTLNTDGGMFLTGGSMGGNPLDPVVKIAKTYWRNTNAWVRNADMKTGRWYPGLVRLPDERLLVLGGELNDPGYGRTNGCEI